MILVFLSYHYVEKYFLRKPGFYFDHFNDDQRDEAYEAIKKYYPVGTPVVNLIADFAEQGVRCQLIKNGIISCAYRGFNWTHMTEVWWPIRIRPKDGFIEEIIYGPFKYPRFRDHFRRQQLHHVPNYTEILVPIARIIASEKLN